MKIIKITRAPYLYKKQWREKDTVYLPPELVAAIEDIAKKEKKSFSYVVQEIIEDWTGVKIRYYEPKNKNKRSRCQH